MLKLRIPLIAGLLAVAAIAASPARADLIIKVNGTVVNVPPGNNDATVFNCTGNCGSAANGGATGWASISLALQGNGLDVFPELFSGTNIDASSRSGAGTLNLTLAETDLTANGVQQFLGTMHGTLTGNLTETRSFFIDPNNGTDTSGLTAIGSITTTCSSNAGCLSDKEFKKFADTGSGLYSIIELITIHPNGRTSENSTDSLAVPEPGTLAILGIGLLGMGAWSRRRKTDNNS